MIPTGWAGPIDLPPVGSPPLVGDVIEFDEPRGLGVLEYGPGRRLDFHCTAIADGSRRIAVGTVVAFTVHAGRLGRLEASSVRPLPGVVPPGSTLPAPVHSWAGPAGVASGPSDPAPEGVPPAGSPGSDAGSTHPSASAG